MNYIECFVLNEIISAYSFYLYFAFCCRGILLIQFVGIPLQFYHIRFPHNEILSMNISYVIFLLSRDVNSWD